jgi:hypothetical protein
MAKEGSWWKVEFSAGEEIEFNLALDGRRYPPLSAAPGASRPCALPG